MAGTITAELEAQAEAAGVELVASSALYEQARDLAQARGVARAREREASELRAELERMRAQLERGWWRRWSLGRE